MYSREIEELLQLKNYILSVKEYFNVCSSSQIKYIKYDPYEDIFYISTEDKYNFKFRVNIDKDKIK